MNQEHELEKYSWPIIPIKVYRGCIVEKIIGGYKIFGKKVKTPSEVDFLIFEAGKSIENSIVGSQETHGGIILP